MTTRLMTVTIAALLVGLVACEKKDPNAPDRSTTEAMKDAAKSTKDAVKDAAHSTKEAVKDAADKAVDAGKQAVDATKEKVQDTAAWLKVQQGMSTYIDTLNDGAATMKGVHDAASANAAEPKLKEMAGKVTAQSAALASLSAEERSKLMAEYRDKIGPAVAAFKAELTRLADDPSVSKPLSDSLKSVKVWEPA